MSWVRNAPERRLWDGGNVLTGADANITRLQA